MKKERHLSTSLWSVIDALQRRFEELGCEPGAVDAAVVRRVDSLMRRRGRNDQQPDSLLAIQPVEG